MIGSADGPTSIFLAGELGMGWISLMGLIIVALLLLLVSAVIFAVSHTRVQQEKMKLIVPDEEEDE